VRANRRAWSIAVVTVGVLTAALVSPAAASAAKLAPAQVRVNQVGYATSAPKVAYAMLPRKVASDPANFVDLGTVDGMRACSAGHFAPYNTKTAAYEDNVVAWPSVEPASDYTANSLLAFVLGAAGLG
jgi:Cellulase N-terminal ig-like domain